VGAVAGVAEVDGVAAVGPVRDEYGICESDDDNENMNKIENLDFTYFGLTRK
jgi:hypothetical protein